MEQVPAGSNSRDEVPGFQSGKPSRDPKERSVGSEDTDSVLPSLQEQLAESRAHIDRLSKEVREKDATIAEMHAVITEKDKLIDQLKERSNVPIDLASDDHDHEMPHNDNGEYVGIEVLGDIDESNEDTYVDVGSEYADVDIDIDSEQRDSPDSEAKGDDGDENVLATSIYEELFPVKPLSVKPRIAGSFPLMTDFTKPFKLLGEGAYGYAFGSELGGTPVVVKVSKTKSSEANAADYHEWSVSERLNGHPNVMQIVGLCPAFSLPLYPQAGTTGIVLPLQENGTLASFIESGLDKTDEWQLANLTFGMIDGIRSLHEQGAIHRDIAMRNFLVDRDGRVVLCDFGLTRFLCTGSTQLENLPKNEKIPWRWMAPESLLSGVFTTQSDIWMFGQTLIEILTGSRPWKDMDTPTRLMEELKTKKGTTCPQSHVLVARPAQDGWTCDICQQPDRFISSKKIYSCRPCGYDVCEACFKLQSSLAPTLPNVPPMIAEVIRECLSSAPDLRPTSKELTDRIWKWQFKEDVVYEGRTGLQCAVYDDTLSEVKALLGTNRAAVNFRNTWGETALMLAKSPEVLCALLDYAPLRKQPTLPIELRSFSHNVTPIDPDTGDSFIAAAIEQGILDPVHALRGCKRDDVVSLVNVRNKVGKTVLHVAAASSNPDFAARAVSNLVAVKSIDLNAQDDFGSTPLHTAVKSNNAEALRVLLAQPGIEVHAIDNQLKTALHVASNLGFIAPLKALLAHKTVDVNFRGVGGVETALFFAVWQNRADVAAVLLSSPTIEVNIQDKDGDTALHEAAFWNHLEVAAVLFSTPTLDVEIQNNEGKTALHFAAEKRHCQFVAELLSCPKIKVNIQDDELENALHKAARKGHNSVVMELLSFPKIEVNMQGKDGYTALHFAAFNGHNRVVMMLLSSPQIKPNIQDKDGETALHVALLSGFKSLRADYSRVAATLVAHHAIAVNIQDKRGYTPLHLAALYGESTLVAKLLATPTIEVNTQIENGRTALHLAVSDGHTEIVSKLLMFPKTAVNIQDNNGSTALLVAADRGHSKAAATLLAHGAIDVNIRDKEGETALHVAAAGGHTDVAAALLTSHQVDLSLQNGKGFTAFQVATQSGSSDVVALLLAHSGP